VPDEPKERTPNSGDIAFDLIDLGVIYGHLARVMRRLASGLPVVDGAGAAECDFILAEALALDARARTIRETKIEPWLVENAKRFSSGKPPWPP